MGFGNFLRGLAAQVNPFDKGKTYGSYNPPQKRKPQPGDPDYQPSRISVGVAQPTQRVVLDQSLQAQQPPENIFDTLNKNLMLGKNNPGVVPVFNNANTQPVQPPKPGMVIHPSTPTPRSTPTPPASSPRTCRG